MVMIVSLFRCGSFSLPPVYDLELNWEWVFRLPLNWPVGSGREILRSEGVAVNLGDRHERSISSKKESMKCSIPYFI